MDAHASSCISGLLCRWCRPNLWPHAHLPELQPAFEALGRRIVEAGLQLVDFCDLYVQSKARINAGSFLPEESPVRLRVLGFCSTLPLSAALQGGGTQSVPSFTGVYCLALTLVHACSC